MAQILYKKGETTRNKAAVYLGGTPLNLAGKTVKVKLAKDVDGAALVTLTAGSGVTVTGGTGEFVWDVTPANLTTLETPEAVWTVIDVWNADNTLAVTASGSVAVQL